MSDSSNNHNGQRDPKWANKYNNQRQEHGGTGRLDKLFYLSLAILVVLIILLILAQSK